MSTQQMVVASTCHTQMPDGTYAVTLVVSGLASEEQAQRAKDHIEKLFCAQPIKPEEFS